MVSEWTRTFVRALSGAGGASALLLAALAWGHGGGIDGHFGHFDKKTGEYHCNASQGAHPEVGGDEEHTHGTPPHTYQHAHAMPAEGAVVQPVQCQANHNSGVPPETGAALQEQVEKSAPELAAARRQRERARAAATGGGAGSGPAPGGGGHVVPILLPDCRVAYTSPALLGLQEVVLKDGTMVTLQLNMTDEAACEPAAADEQSDAAGKPGRAHESAEGRGDEAESEPDEAAGGAGDEVDR
ncbi:MAG: hypothetical protein HYV63_11615 [Candidatus Schekmanbacteria bacterium]|nr:hypothetical protein [Candidatus Schekmanbacteria bacterium]